MIKVDSLDALNDNELQEVITHSETLLKKRDEERKAKALADARALRAKAESDARAVLESAGLSLKSLGGRNKGKGSGKPLYKGGRVYQHPSDKTLFWRANGQKPKWLRELEAHGAKAIEVKTEED